MNRALVIDSITARNRLTMMGELAHETPQALGIRRPGELLDQLTLVGQHAHIQPPAAQIQPNMQHEGSAAALPHSG